MLPAAGLILLVALLIAATLVPWLTGTLAARTEARHAAARGELTSSVLDLIEGAPELAVSGATAEQLGRALAADTEVTQIAGTAARTAGIGQGLTSLCSGLAMWGALLVWRLSGQRGAVARRSARRDRADPVGRIRAGLRSPESDPEPAACTPLGGARVRGDGYTAARVGASTPGCAPPRATRSAGARSALQVPGSGALGTERARSGPEPGPARGGDRCERRRQVDARRGAAALSPL